MAKAMMFTKKPKAPSTGGDNNEASEVAGADDGDTVTCPNCKCEFNDETMDVVKPGKPVEGGYDESKNHGEDLELSEFPDGDTHFGAAHDAAGGEAAITQAVNTAIRRGK